MLEYSGAVEPSDEGGELVRELWPVE